MILWARRNIFYCVLGLLTAIGWTWLFLNNSYPGGNITICIFKNVTGIPCPSCGSTRALLHILHGDWKNALFVNPVGFLLFITLVILPFWITSDYINRKKTLYRLVTKTEEQIRKKPIALILFGIMISINWIWNIYKDL